MTKSEEYDILYAKQNGKCAICGKRSPKRRFDRDHDHTLERDYQIYVLRGLLCRRCNEGLGRFEYSDDVIERTIKYLQMIKRLRKKYRSTHGAESN